MDVNEAVARLRRVHASAGLGDLSQPGPRVEEAIGRIAAAVQPWRIPADLLAFWRGIDPDGLAVAPCPRPAGPDLALRLWREHLSPDWGLESYLPWCYESHEFMLVELDEPERARGGCFSWTGGADPVVGAFGSVGAYVDLLATMIELGEFAHHAELGVIEFDPARRWSDAQAVRLATSRRDNGAAGPADAADSVLALAVTTIADLLARAEAGETPSGVIQAQVVSMSGSASGQRIQVTDETGRLDLSCRASLCGNGPVINHQYEFHVTLQPGCQELSDAAAALSNVERATRRGDLHMAVTLATPLYDQLFGTPAQAQATAIRSLP